jgi:hypothetical protein
VQQAHTVEEQRAGRRRSPRPVDRDADDQDSAAQDSGALSDREGYNPGFVGRRVMMPTLTSFATESFGNPYVLPSTGKNSCCVSVLDTVGFTLHLQYR